MTVVSLTKSKHNRIQDVAFLHKNIAIQKMNLLTNYRIVVSTSLSCIEAHAGLFRMSMKGIFDASIFELVMHIRTQDYAVFRKFFDST